MDDGPDVGDAEIVENAVDPRLDVRLDFRKRRNERQRRAVARVRVLGHAHQSLTGKLRGRSLGEGVDLFGHFVTVVNPSEIDRPLRSMRERHAGTSTLARDPFVCYDIVLAPAAPIPG